MNEETIKELKSFASELYHAAELVEYSTVNKYGQKSTAKRAKKALNEIRKKIADVRKKLLV